MKAFRRALILVFAVISASALGAPSPRSPYIGFVYPAGGRTGTKFQVVLRGQRLNAVRDAYFSGKGIQATVVDYTGPGGKLNKLQQEELIRRLREIRAKRLGPAASARQADKAEKKPGKQQADANTGPVELPDLPDLRNLDQLNALQLKKIADKYANPSKRIKPPLAEEVVLEVTVAKNAEPGDREIRLRTPQGLSNPLVFEVGDIPETREPDLKSINPGVFSPVAPPVVINGQILPGEVDRYPLDLKAGQRLVISVEARKLIPYLADAVPGWFQAVVALRDSDGKEVAYDDDCGFDPDPALLVRVPRTGRYTLEVRDSIYRGREDFVYRVVVGEPSRVKSLFPSGGRGGVPVVTARLDQDSQLSAAREYFGFEGNPLAETEPNNSAQAAMSITEGAGIISGVISEPADKDWFEFDGKAGQTVVAEVFARRTGSPLDSLLRLTDASGKVIAWNDDDPDKASGLLTHHADSRLTAKLPAAGKYFVQISDAQRHGGPDFRYFLRVGPPKPDFALRMTPSAVSIPAGRAAEVTVYALKKDGWDGDIDISFAGDSTGFSLGGARIPKGHDHVRMTISADQGRWTEPVSLHLDGTAEITRPVVPADDMEQAFAYHHLVPAQEFLAVVSRKGAGNISLDLADGDRVVIPSGGSAQVSYTVRPSLPKMSVQLELSDPPAGISLGDVVVSGNTLRFTVKADDKHAGYADNLIVEAFTEVAPQGKAANSTQKQRFSLGVLPAIPFQIVAR